MRVTDRLSRVLLGVGGSFNELETIQGHPCYDIDPSNGGLDGHACWPKGRILPYLFSLPETLGIVVPVPSRAECSLTMMV